MEIYIKPVEKARIVRNRDVTLKDVAEVFVGGKAAEKAEELVVFHVPQERKKTYLLSVMDVIRILHQQFPEAVVSNVGQADILIEYLPKPEKKSRLWTVLKVIFVS